MNKQVINLLVMAFMLAFVSQAFAETKLNLSGKYSLRSWAEINPYFDSDAKEDRYYLEHELETYTNLKVTEKYTRILDCYYWQWSIRPRYGRLGWLGSSKRRL